MKRFDTEKQENIEINNLLQRIKCEVDKQEPNTFIYFPFLNILDKHNIKFKESAVTQFFFEKLEKMGAIENIFPTKDEINQIWEEDHKSKDKATLTSFGYFVRPIEPSFSQICKIYEQKINDKTKKHTSTKKYKKNFVLQVKDRSIFINNYLIGKPYGVGVNYVFFDHIRLQKPYTEIKRNELPWGVRQEVQNKRFINILNELGFKKDILKAFFPKRSNDMVVYIGDKVTEKDLKKAGIDKISFSEQLEKAHKYKRKKHHGLK